MSPRDDSICIEARRRQSDSELAGDQPGADDATSPAFSCRRTQ